jgi:hypothetical protein
MVRSSWSLETYQGVTETLTPWSRIFISSLFWDVTQRRLVVRRRRFGTINRFPLSRARQLEKKDNLLELLYPRKMWPRSCFETSASVDWVTPGRSEISFTQPWNQKSRQRDLSWKIIAFELVKTFPAFCKTWTFITSLVAVLNQTNPVHTTTQCCLLDLY